MSNFAYWCHITRNRIFLEPEGGRGGGGEAPVPTAPDAAMLAALPGGELLSGSTSGEARLDGDGDGLPKEWTEGNATGEESEAVTEGAAPTEEAEVQTPALEEAEQEKEKDGAAAELPPEWPEEARTRITSTEAELATVKSEKETLTKELETVKAGTAPAVQVLSPTPESPLAGVTDEQGLSRHITLAQEIKDFATRSLAEGGTMPKHIQALFEGKKVGELTEDREVTPAEAADLLVHAGQMLERHIPARKEYLVVEGQSRKFLEANFPAFLDSKKEEGQLFSAFLQQFPQIKTLPRWPTILAATVRGQMAIEAEIKTKEDAKRGKGVPAPKAPVPPNSAAAAPVTPKVSATDKAKRPVVLSASMDAEQLAATLN